MNKLDRFSVFGSNITIHLIGLGLLISVFFYRLVKWTLYSFGGVTSDQILFHLYANTVGTPENITRKLILEAGVKPIITIIVFYAALYVVKKLKFPRAPVLFFSLCISLVLLLSSGKKSYEMFFDPRVSAHFKLEHQNNDWIGNVYKTPEVSIAPNSNLVWIYFESLESRYVNKENFLKKNGNDLELGFTSLNGTGWTHAGILSSQCGIPLLVDPFFGRGNKMEGTLCLPDILSKQKYSIHFIGGADTGFSGKGEFLSAHNINSITGKQELKKILVDAPPSAYEHWGYNDDHVLPILESDVLRLHRNREKFYYVALTLDTHGPLIYTDFCRQQGFQNTEAGVYFCGLKRIQNIIKNWEAAGVLQNTTIVISGDHPAMRTYSFTWSEIFKNERIKREKVYFYARPATSLQNRLSKRKNSNINHFDLYPTVFYLMGGKFVNDSAGLGRNVINIPSLSDSYEEDEFNYLLTRPSESYDALRAK